jgi:hypothetical protein
MRKMKNTQTASASVEVMPLSNALSRVRARATHPPS